MSISNLKKDFFGGGFVFVSVCAYLGVLFSFVCNVCMREVERAS